MIKFNVICYFSELTENSLLTNRFIEKGMGVKKMKEAIKVLFEATDGYIEKLNINKDILKSAMNELTDEYISEGNYELAFKAAQLTEQPGNVRKVFESIKDQSITINRVGIQGLLELFQQHRLFFDILMASGTGNELKEYAIALEEGGYINFDKVICIYEKLQDASALLRFGNELVTTYFETIKKEKRESSYCLGTSSIPKCALKVFEKAKKIGANGINKVLVNFGDRLFRHHGYKILDSTASSGSKTPEAIQAYQMAGTPSSMEKAAQGYLEIENLNAAAELFHKIGNNARVKDIIFQIIRKGNFVEGISLRTKLFEIPVSAEELKIFMNVATDGAKRNVLQEIEKYLVSHDNDMPFWTNYTFWHFSDSNDEWGCYLATVHGLAGRTDVHYYKTYTSIAKELYATDKVDVIAEILLSLQGHLLVGYMLSALELEVDGTCPSRIRKYEHAFDAAFRTFSYGIKGEGYNPFYSFLDLKKDSDIAGLYEEILKFHKERCALMTEKNGALSHNNRSHAFLYENSKKLQEKTREVYKKLAEKIRALMTQL